MTLIRRLARAARLGALAATAFALAHWSAWPASAKSQCQADLFCVTALENGRSIELWLESLTETILTVAFAVEAERLEGDARAKRLVLEGPGRQLVYAFKKPPGFGGELVGRDWSLDWHYSFHLGRQATRHDDAAVYRLPYAPGAAFEVVQGAGGAFTHRGHLRYAIDWAMPEGTEIRAARAGVVVGLHASSDRGGPIPDYLGSENYVWIKHEDGTLGQYQHIQKDGVLVTLGQKVEAGEAIALSGNSGYSTAPHLHFHVSTPSPGPEAFTTLPLRFRLADGSAASLLAGRRYRAP